MLSSPETEVRADARGYRAALRFAARYAAGRRVWAIEGSGSYGAGLARYLTQRGEIVLELSRTPRGERRLRGKDDALDAVRTARAALASRTLTLPRAGQRREALRLLLLARRSAVDVRREALGQLRGVIVTAPDQLRQELRGLPVGKLLDRCRRLRRSARPAPMSSRRGSSSVASPCGSQAATSEAEQLERELLGHVRALAPALLDEPGVGPDRRRAADRRLVTPRPAPLRSRLRPPRRGRTRPRLKRANAHGTGSAAAATANSTAHCTPSPCTADSTTPHPRLHRATDRRRKEPTRRHTAPQALPRPPPLPTTQQQQPAMT